MSLLAEIPRVALGTLPTPLSLAERFSEVVGVETWIKHDDHGSLGLAGNKVRKLEFVAAEVVRDDIDTIVAVGNAQSNATRTVAAVSARLGVCCELVLGGSAPQEGSGNVLLSAMFGARLHYAGTTAWDELQQAADLLAGQLETKGRRVMNLPVGISTPLGAIGFVSAYAELTRQLEASGVTCGAIVHASGGGGTHAGLVVGRTATGPGPQPLGVAVARDVQPDMAGHCVELARATAGRLGLDPNQIDGDQVSLDFDFVGPGYGVPTDAGIEAINLLSRMEAVACDPVYTGKALAALIEWGRAGRFDRPVVFWHTGGVPAIFDPSYARPLWERARINSEGESGPSQVGGFARVPRNGIASPRTS